MLSGIWSSGHWSARADAASRDSTVRTVQCRGREPVRRRRRHPRARATSGTGSRRARTSADRTAGTAGRRPRPTSLDHCGARHGAERTGSVGPYSADDRDTCSSRRCAAVRCRRRCRAPPDPRARAVRRARTRRRRGRDRRPPGSSSARARSITSAAAARSEGPEVTMTRRRCVAARDQRDERREGLERPAPERVARAHVNDDHADRRRGRPRASRRAATASAARGSDRHLDGSVAGVGRRNAERVEQIPLVLDGMTRPEVRGVAARESCTSIRGRGRRTRRGRVRPTARS